ncbi:late embryogenesis abundant protein-related / LEA protein-related [Euphorbia peplus]|nr:late embryogenesis abundant protein-related / LEA protein-related [Euphorbia peplus]
MASKRLIIALIVFLIVVFVGVGEAVTPPGIAKNPSHARCLIKKYKMCYNLEHVCPKFCPDSCTVDCNSCKPICSGATSPPSTPKTPPSYPPPPPPHSPPPKSPPPPTITPPTKPPTPTPPTSPPSPSPTPPTPTPSSPPPPPPSPAPPTPTPSSPPPPPPSPTPPTPTPSSPPPPSPTPPTPTPSSPPPASPPTPTPSPPPPSPTPPTSTPSSPPTPTPSTPPSSPPPSSPPPPSPTPPTSTPSSPPPASPPTPTPSTPPSSPPPSSPPPPSPTPPTSTPSSPPPPTPTPPTSTPSPKTAKCKAKYYPQCYNTQHVCPSDCPGECEVDCVTCKPICSCDKPGAVCQDPRFIGGDGLTFYFHGKKDQDFCLVSDPNLHINAHFIGKRNEKMTRDFTWVQSIALLFGKHQLFIGALKTSTWDDSIDRLSLSFDGKPITVAKNEGNSWQYSTNSPTISVTRISDTNNVVIEVEGHLKITAKVVPITEEDSRIHNYGITNEDCFAHLDLGFKFYSLSDQVNGVLGQTYNPGYVSRVNMGAKMPVMGGNKEFSTSSLFVTDCAVSRFSDESVFDKKGSLSEFELPGLTCASGIGGQGVVCKR